MGIDACIEFKVREGAEVPDLYFPEGVTVEPAHYTDMGATHEVSTCWRYYGAGYERGPWPEIAAILMKLLASDAVETVWYFGDCSDAGPPFTVGDLFALTLHYIANAERPYRQGAPRVAIEWPDKQECP